MNLPDLSQHAGIRLDCETDGLRWFDGARPVGFSWLLPGTGERGYAAFGHDSGNNCTPEEAREWARRELRGKHICNAKTKFDIHMIREFGADLAEQGCTFSDVAYNAALLDDNRYEFNVDILARDFLPEGTTGKLKEIGGVAIDKTRIKSYPGHVLAPYAIRDVELVDLLDVETLRRIREEDLLRVYDLENSVIPVVCEMERNAAPLDLDLLDSWEKETFDELRAACWKIYRATGVRFECERETLFGTQPIDPKFPVAEKRRLFKIRGVPVPIKKELDGERIIEKESFEDDLLAPIDDEIIRTFRYALQLQSLRAKYIVKYKNVVGRDGLLRYELNQLACGDEESKGTVSGRFSSSGGDKRDPFGVNIQQVFSLDNQAKTLVNRWVIRKLFKPAVGQWFRADAKQIEYRLFAHYANSPKINAVYARDREADFHQTVCDLLNTVIEINRKHTKNVNFACVFGAGMGKFAEMCGLVDGYGWQEATFGSQTRRWFGPIPSKRAVELYQAYMGMFPEVKPLLRKAAKLVETRGYVKTAMGRRARCYKKPHSGLNRIIQGTAASINKKKLRRVYDERKNLEFTMRFTVHDELDGDLRNPEKFDALTAILNDQDFVEFQNKSTGRRETSRIPILWDSATAENWAAAS